MRNPRERTYPARTFDDPKTKDWLWEEKYEPECDFCPSPPEYKKDGEVYCEDCLYEAWQNDLPDCQCSYDDYKWSPDVEHL